MNCKHRVAILWIGILLAAAATALVWKMRAAQAPHGPYRIGYGQDVPFHYAQSNGNPAGIVYDVVAEAAKRAGIELTWIQCLEGSEPAMRDGKVDIWPMMADLPERRKYFYVSDPWIGGDFFILVRKSHGLIDRTFRGSIGHTPGGVRPRMIRGSFPYATTVQLSTSDDLIRAICGGTITAGLFAVSEARMALQTKLPECSNLELLAFPVQGMRMEFGIGANYPFRSIATRILKEIHGLAREGFIFSALARHSNFGYNEITATYSLLRLEEQRRWLYWGIAALSLGLALALVLCWSLYIAKQALARADAEKAESVTRYALASRATNDAIWDWDLDSGQVSWSELVEALFGYPSAEVNRTMEWRNQHVHPEDRKGVIDSIGSALAEGQKTWSAEYRFLCKNNRYVHVVDRAHIVYGQDGKPSRMIGAMSDVSPRRTLEEQLRQSQKMEAIGRLAGGVAHDFNNLLTVINGYSDLLQGAEGANQEIREYAAAIQKAGLSAASLTQQLLAFSRRQIIELKPLNLNAIIQDAEKMISRLLGENIQTILNLNSKPGTVLVDPGQMCQVIINLAINARDAMPEGGKLLIETRSVELDADYTMQHSQVRPGSYELLEISDTGIGMDKETLPHIFEPFYTTKSKSKGTGLGLSTVYGIIKQSSGWIWAYSESGQGTTFKIYLPHTEESIPTDASMHHVKTDTHGSETILLVEDQSDVRRLAMNILSGSGYIVLEADCAEAALRIMDCDSRPIQLILADVVLPGLSGRDLAQRVMSSRPEIKFLYMSGYTENIISHRGIIEPGIAFLPKPFSPGELLEKVRHTLDSD